jgi:hypothetical protein
MELQLGRIELGQENAAAAGVLAGRARETFEREGLPVRAAYARFVEAQALRAGGDSDAAFESARSALGGLDGYHAGWVSYQCRDLLASLHAGRGERGEAARLYREALGEIEALRGNLELDEFRMAFGRDKYQVYENLVALELEMGNTADAFGIVERSKSRTLIDMLERNTASAWRSGAGGKTGEEVRRLREELNGLYTRLSRPGAMAGRSVVNRALREEIGVREQALIEVLREAASEQAPWAVLEASPPPDVSGIQRMLARDEVLVEYYTIRERYCAFVIGKTEFAVFEALGTRAEVQEALKGLTFQMSKFMLAGAYLEDRRDQLLSSVRFHLRTLYDCLIAPLEGRLSGRSLVVVPHGVLHHVPFHALYDGSEHLIDRHDVVYGASAAVIRLCRERRRPPGTVRDLVLAVPDEAAPSLAEEAQVLGALLPQADVFVGEEATAAVLARYGRAAGRVHIAAHGVFRGDNPLFSSLRLGDTWLNLVDVFRVLGRALARGA